MSNFNEINVWGVIILTLWLVFTGFMSALIAAESREQASKEEQSQATWIIFLVFNAVMGITIKVMPPVVYAIILVLIAALQLINREGRMRRESWNWLAFGYVVILIMSVVYHRTNFSIKMLFWLIPAALPFIAGVIQTKRLDSVEKKRKVSSIELSTQIIPWAIIAVLVLTWIAILLV